MANNTDVSVVIPAYNEQEFVRAAIASVANQSFPLERIECLIVDNCSEDATAQIARDAAGEWPHLAIKVLAEPLPSVGRAKNTGARAARGEVLIFLDADSRMEPELIAQVAARYSAGIQAGSIRVRADSTHPLERGFFELMEVGKVWLGVRSQMMYCGRDLFQAVGGFNPCLHLAEDLEFLDRVRAHVRTKGLAPVCHIRTSSIATSPRRLRERPLHLGMVTMFARWALAFAGIGRTRRY